MSQHSHSPPHNAVLHHLQLFYITCPSEEVAERIVRKALEASLVACANIFDGARSLYVWEGEIHDERETIITLKTWSDCADSLLEVVLQEHPYDCPCIVYFSANGGHGEYLDWVKSQTRGAGLSGKPAHRGVPSTTGE